MYENEFWILAPILFKEKKKKKLSCTLRNFPNWWEAYPVLGEIDLHCGFWRSLYFVAKLFNSFLAQLAWLPVEKSSDLNLVTESPWTCDNLRPISVLTPNFYSICLHAPIQLPRTRSLPDATQRLLYLDKWCKNGRPWNHFPSKPFYCQTCGICLFNLKKKISCSLCWLPRTCRGCSAWCEWWKYRWGV